MAKDMAKDVVKELAKPWAEGETSTTQQNQSFECTTLCIEEAWRNPYEGELNLDGPQPQMTEEN